MKFQNYVMNAKNNHPPEKKNWTKLNKKKTTTKQIQKMQRSKKCIETQKIHISAAIRGFLPVAIILPAFGTFVFTWIIIDIIITMN